MRPYPDSRIAANARAFPSRAATVAADGSPHTVARPCRPLTGFRRKRRYRDCAKVAAFLLAYSQKVRRTLHFGLASLTLLLGACNAHSTANVQTAPSNTSSRVVTLVPSFADDLYAIGAVSQLVGVSAYTDAPRTAALPRIADATSVDAEAILRLKPSVVVGIPAQSRLVEPLRRARVPVVLLPDDSYASIFANLREMGSLTGHRREADGRDRSPAARNRTASRTHGALCAPPERLRGARCGADLDRGGSIVYHDIDRACGRRQHGKRSRRRLRRI